MHLTEFSVENFRIFKKESFIKLSPLTFFVGPNNSGKSSLIKVLLLLKDTFQHYQTNLLSEDPSIHSFKVNPELHNFPFSLIFNNNSGHNLGTFENVLCNHSKKKELKITLPFLLPEFKEGIYGKMVLTYQKSTNDNSNSLNRIIIKSGKTKLLEIKNISQLNRPYSISLNYGWLTALFNQDILKFERSVARIDDHEKLDFGFQKHETGFMFIGPEGEDNNKKKGEPISSFDIFGYTAYKHIHILDEVTDLFLVNKSPYTSEELSNKNKATYSSDLKNLMATYIEEHTDQEEYLTFQEKSYYNQLPSLRSQFLASFNNFLIDAYYAGKNNNALGNFSGLNSFRSGRKKPSGIPVGLSNYGTFIIGLLDRAIFFNLSLYTEIFSELNLYPNLDLRYEKLIDLNDGLIYKLLDNKLFSSSNAKSDPVDFYQGLRDFIKLVINEIGIGEDISVEQYKNYGFEVNIKNKGKLIPISNYGYGIRKLLTLVLRIAGQAYEKMSFLDNEISWEASILVIEEPESNLHPKLQSLLADIFVVAARNFNIQFIIETHSEYLIRKLQFLVAQQENLVSYKDISIYYFNDVDEINEESPRRIEIRPDGILKQEFGHGFFDESIKWTMKLLNLSEMN